MIIVATEPTARREGGGGAIISFGGLSMDFSTDLHGKRTGRMRDRIRIVLIIGKIALEKRSHGGGRRRAFLDIASVDVLGDTERREQGCADDDGQQGPIADRGGC